MNRQGSLLYKRVEFGEAFEDVWEVFFIDSFSCVGHIKTDFLFVHLVSYGYGAFGSGCGLLFRSRP